MRQLWDGTAQTQRRRINQPLRTPSSHLLHVKAHLRRHYVSRTPSPFIALLLACSWSFSAQRCSTLSFKLAYYTAECQVLSLR